MDVPLCGLFVFVVVFLSSGSGVLLVIVFLRVCSVSPSVAMFFVVVQCCAEVGFVPLEVFARATEVR